MAKQALFYADAAPVSPARHGDVSVKAVGAFAFAREANSVPLTVAEFAAAAGEYPIVFAGEGDAVISSAILGVEGARNAFVDAGGAFTGGYIPHFILRYPFVFSDETEDGRLILHIDESFEGVNRDGRGERLFDADGAQTQYLRGVLAFLKEYQARFQRTVAFCARLVEHDLLRPMQATFTLPSGRQRALTGFKTVDRERLKSLGDAALLRMFRTDELECVFLHLHSIRHFGKVAELSGGEARSETPGEIAPEPQAAAEASA